MELEERIKEFREVDRKELKQLFFNFLVVFTYGDMENGRLVRHAVPTKDFIEARDYKNKIALLNQMDIDVDIEVINLDDYHFNNKKTKVYLKIPEPIFNKLTVVGYLVMN